MVLPCLRVVGNLETNGDLAEVGRKRKKQKHRHYRPRYVHSPLEVRSLLVVAIGRSGMSSIIFCHVSLSLATLI
jgi:hypothetical protein